MMKKICSIALFSALIVVITGCENSSSNNTLFCTSDSTSVMTDIYVSGHSTTEEGEHIKENPEDWSVSIGRGNEDLEDGEYSFIYNDEGLISIEGKEVYKKSFSNQVTDEMIDELNKVDNVNAYKKNGKVVVEYTLKNDNITKVLSAHYKTKKELKEFLEEGTFSCK